MATEAGMYATGTGGGQRAYTTSKQVQAWFLRKGRDLWKAKCRVVPHDIGKDDSRIGLDLARLGDK